jgi:hypothetical protein
MVMWAELACIVIENAENIQIKVDVSAHDTGILPLPEACIMG